MAIHAPITGGRTHAPYIIKPQWRTALEAEIESHLQRAELLIARLDRADGDPDLEDDNEDCCALERMPEADSDDGAGLLPTRPMYALDQTQAPINHAAASRDHEARRMGAVPNGRGGWRWPS